MRDKSIEELHALLILRDQELRDKSEELESQRGMLSAAIQELIKKNKRLNETLGIAEERNSELESILYQLSHGLRSPLNSLLGLIHLLRHEPMEEPIKSYVDHIDIKSSHMMEIMNSLSTLSKLKTHNVESTLVDVEHILQGLVIYFSRIQLSNNVTIEHTCDLNDKAVYSDPFLIGEIIKQLMMNAIVFRSREKVGQLLIHFSIQDAKLLFKIQDDGEGISDSFADQIYEMFFRGSERSGGTGLGLFIVKEAIDRLSGSISFTSSDLGTTFFVTVPIAERS